MPPARSPDGPMHALVQPLTLEAALREAGRALSSADIHVVRYDMVRMINAVLREGGNADTAIKGMLNDLSLGIQYLEHERGREAVLSGLQPAKRHGEVTTRLPQLLTLGRTQRIEKVTRPLQELIRRNSVSVEADEKEEAISGVVDNDTHRTGMLSIVITSQQRKALLDGTCATYSALYMQAEALQKLHRILDVADHMGIDARVIKAALEPGIESGLRHIVAETRSSGASYLEMAVFCRVAAKRWKLELPTPLTLPNKAASLFARDMRAESWSKCNSLYERHCTEELFGEDTTHARLLLKNCLDSLQAGWRATSDGGGLVHAEYHVPVHQFSAAALRNPEVIDPESLD